MKVLRFVGTLLVMIACFFGLGMLSAKLEKPNETKSTLVFEGAVNGTTLQESYNPQYFVFEYKCHGETLASFDVNSKQYYAKETPTIPPYRASMTEATEFVMLATGYEAKTWAQSIFGNTAKEASKAEKIGLLLAAGTGFLAGRWYVEGKALNCRDTDVLSSFQGTDGEKFWQRVAKKRLQLIYSGAQY